MVHDACTGDWQKGTDEDGNPIWDVEGFLEQTLKFDGRMFDVVLAVDGARLPARSSW